MRRISLAFAVAAVVAAAVPAFAAGSPASGLRFDPNHKITNSTSTNWSGYAATGTTFTSISSSWTEPTATCNFGTAYSSFWVGLDGYSSNSVEQTGTDADCSSANIPQYYAWYEMYPKFPVNLSNPVKPGDAMSASVTVDHVGRFTLSIADSTQNWTFSTSQRANKASLSSAEVIAEAPSSRGGVLPLANFSTMKFGASTANSASLASFKPDGITMASGSQIKAQPGSIGADGSFSVTWQHQ